MKKIFYLVDEYDFVLDISLSDKTDLDNDIQYDMCELTEVQYKNIIKSLDNAKINTDIDTYIDNLDTQQLIYKIYGSNSSDVHNTLMSSIREKESKLGNVESLESFIMDPERFNLKIPKIKELIETLVQLDDKLFTKIMSMISTGVINIWDFEPILCRNKNYENMVRSTLTEYVNKKNSFDNFDELNFNNKSQRSNYESIILTYFKNDPKIYKELNGNNNLINKILVFATDQYNTTTNIDKINITETDLDYIRDNGLSVDEFKKIKTLTHHLYNKSNLKFGFHNNMKTDNTDNIISLMQDVNDATFGYSYTSNKNNNFKLSFNIPFNTLSEIILIKNNVESYLKTGEGEELKLSSYSNFIEHNEDVIYDENDTEVSIIIIKYKDTLELKILKESNIVFENTSSISKDPVYIMMKIANNKVLKTNSAIKNIKFINLLR